MDTLLALLAIAVAIVIVAAVVRSVAGLVTIHEHERGLRYRNGRFRGLVGAGVYPVLVPFSEVRVLDLRPGWMVLEAQEVPTADGVVVKISLAARYAVGDPVAAHTGDQDHRRALHLALQLGLRDAVARRTLDETLAARSALGSEIAEASALDLARIGVELLTVQVRDVILPAELKRAFAGVIAARKEGEAALERTRGETAALRNLANAGRLVDENPGLLSLRIVQQLGQTSGNSIVVTLPGAGSGHGEPAEAVQPVIGDAAPPRPSRSRRSAAPSPDSGMPPTPG